MPSSYVFEFYPETPSAGWDVSSDEYWPIEVYEFTGQERKIGTRRIDGSLCVVFACPDHITRAMTRTAAQAYTFLFFNGPSPAHYGPAVETARIPDPMG